jgi:hypothetical protein
MKQEYFTGTLWEHGTVMLVLVFWAAGLPNLLDPDNQLAITDFSMIKNANLFFSSWFAFIVVMIMFVQIFPSLVFKDKVSMFASHWIGFGTASLIAMTNAARFWKDVCDSTDEAVCAKTVFAFILGALGGLFAIVFMVFQHELIEQMMSILFFAAWCFGVAYLTYNDGPAMFVGIYFFSVWTSFLFALCMATESFVTLWSRFMGTENVETEEGGTTPATGEGETAGKGAEETAKHDEEEAEKEDTN